MSVGPRRAYRGLVVLQLLIIFAIIFRNISILCNGFGMLEC
jgi:hypothetical protein